MLRYFKLVAIVLGTTILLLASLFAEAGAVSIAEIQTIVLFRHPSTATLDYEIEMARGSMIQAGLPLNPTVGYATEEVGVGGTAGKRGLVVS